MKPTAIIATVLAGSLFFGPLAAVGQAQTTQPSQRKPSAGSVSTAAASPSAGQVAPAHTAAAPQAGTPDATPPAAERGAYIVTGFRSARFGMNHERVTDAVQRDFQVDAAALKSVDNPADVTSALIANVATLEPVNGPATITYILGKDSQKLVHVNVVWLLEGNAAEGQREALAIAGMKLADYFASHSWEGGRSIKNMPAGANSVVAFVAKDKAGAAVEVRLDGVAYTTMVDGQQKKSPAAAGPARLRIAYALSPSRPDVAKIAKGAF